MIIYALNKIDLPKCFPWGLHFTHVLEGHTACMTLRLALSWRHTAGRRADAGVALSMHPSGQLNPRTLVGLQRLQQDYCRRECQQQPEESVSSSSCTQEVAGLQEPALRTAAWASLSAAETVSAVESLSAAGGCRAQVSPACRQLSGVSSADMRSAE
jgi:hypothetical protein